MKVLVQRGEARIARRYTDDLSKYKRVSFGEFRAPSLRGGAFFGTWVRADATRRRRGLLGWRPSEQPR
jgi:hypothetical protein